MALVELKIFKVYIKINLANGFILALKSLVGAPILFIHKHDSSFCLCVNYWGLKNLMIKNWYQLLLIDKSLDWRNQAKQVTQLNLTSAYHLIRIKESDE